MQTISTSYDIQRADRPTNLSNEDVYLTIQAKNTNSNQTIECTYDEIRLQSLLNYPANRYKVALTNLSISLNQIYLSNFPPQFLEDGVTINPAAYSVTLNLYDDQFGPTPLRSQVYLQPVNFIASDPAEFGVVRGWLYNQYMISLNAAFQTAFNNIITQYNAGGFTPATYAGNAAYPQQPPTIVCETESSLFYIKCPFLMNTDYTNPNATINPPLYSTTANHVAMTIGMNKNLYQLFFSFPAIFNGWDVPNDPNGNDAILRIYDQGYGSGNDTLIYYNTVSNTFTSYFQPTLPLVPQFYKVYQSVSSTNNFSDSDSIVVTCPNMQIRPTFLNVPSPLSSLQNAGTTVPLNILHPPISLKLSSFSNAEEFSYFNWEETGEYRFYDIYSHTQFNRINFTINVYTKEGQLFPILLNPGQIGEITLVFRLK